MQHFWKQVGKVRWTIVLGLTMAILNAACDLFWPTIIATIVDDGILVGNADHIRKMLIVMVCVGLFAAVVKYSKNCCAVISGNRYARNTRRDLFEKVLSLPSGDVSRMGTASLLTRCTNDISAIGLTLDQFIRMMVRIPLTCIGGMILAHDARLFLIFLITEILLTLVTQYICVMPLSLCILFPAVYAWQTGDVTGTLILLTLVPVIVYKHLPNIRRILAGKEMRVSWLWNPQREESRIQKNFTEEEWSQLSRKVKHK